MSSTAVSAIAAADCRRCCALRAPHAAAVACRCCCTLRALLAAVACRCCCALRALPALLSCFAGFPAPLSPVAAAALCGLFPRRCCLSLLLCFAGSSRAAVAFIIFLPASLLPSRDYTVRNIMLGFFFVGPKFAPSCLKSWLQTWTRMPSRFSVTGTKERVNLSELTCNKSTKTLTLFCFLSQAFANSRPIQF